MQVCHFFRLVIIVNIMLMFGASTTNISHAQSQAVPPKSTAETTGKNGEKTVVFNFDSVDIRAFIKYVSQFTGKNFVVDESVKGTVTVVSPQPLSLDEASKVFESVLEVNGYTTLPAGRFTKIVPAKTSRSRSMETLEGQQGSASPEDRIVTQIIPLHNISSPELRKILTPMVSPDGLIADYADTNTLIITDFRPNIQRLQAIISQLDIPAAKASISLFTLKYSAASKLAQKIDKILSQESKKEGGIRIGVASDERTNSLIVLADPGHMAQIKNLISSLDVPSSRAQGNFKVYALQHAEAENLSKVLTDLLGKGGGGSTEGLAQAQKPPVSEGIRFVADKTTNSLLVTADPEDLTFLDGVIAKLDSPRKQVYVEALIMEVSTDKSFSFGVDVNVANSQRALGDGKGGGLIFGSSNPAGYQSLYGSSGALVPPAGLAMGVVAFPVKIGEVVYSNLQTLINAAKADNSFNIIATPQLMTLDNQEATITVAENRPYLTSQDVGQNQLDRPYQRFDYKDVGTTLKVTPQINEGNTIKLKIHQETSRIDETVTQQTGTLQPTTRKRVTETTVLAQDGQTIVLSGIIDKSRNEGHSKVPYLGDVPMFGWFFKKRQEQDTKTNLFLFITPRIASDPKENEKILYARKESIESQLYLYRKTEASLGPICKAPVLFNPVLR